MASVQNSRAAKSARIGLPEDEAPEHVPSAGELLIKQLARKQVNTKITLEEQLKEEKKFKRGVGCVLIGEFAPGTSSLQDFKKSQLRAEKIQEYEGRGLTRSEAEAELSGHKNSKASPAAIAANQIHVQQQLTSQPPPRPEASVSRRELELATSVKPDSVETQLYKFAIQHKTTGYTDSMPPDHPVHSLLEMEQSLTQMASADPQKVAKTVRRKRRQLLEALAEPLGVHFKPPEPNGSLWDCIEPPVIVPKQPQRPVRIATCQRETLYTVEDGKIIPLNGAKGYKSEHGNRGKCKETAAGQPFVAFELLSKELKISDRLNEQEIKKIPRFENYERGQVSQVLYIKNLSISVTEDELITLFAKFQEENEEKIIFRLMNGKMRGQAFVTFKNCEIATKALDEINGTILQGKPMIIQYGRHKT